MKNIILTLLTLMCLGCESDVKDNTTVTSKSSRSYGHELIRIDNCQYFYRVRGYSAYLSHKGDCDWEGHCHNK